jgi:hypothetical protein
MATSRFDILAATLSLIALVTACSVHERNLQYDSVSCSSDASCQGSLRCYGGTCCEPSPLSGSECSLPACGCREGQVCDLDGATKTMKCRTTNDVQEGQACSYPGAVCAAGLGCFGGVCKPYCQRDTECKAVAGVQECQQTVWSDRTDITGVGVCSRVCDPVNPQDPATPLLSCPRGASCNPGSKGASDCGWAGTGQVGDYCDASTRCAPGNYCTAWGTCNRFCYKNEDCPEGIACGAFLDDESAGTLLVGACKVSLKDAINQEYTQQCKKMAECAPGYLSYYYGTVADCVERTRLFTPWLLALPSTNLTLDLVAKCTDALSNVACSDYLTSDPDECWIAGALADGSPCNVSSQCASMYCNFQSWSCGTCAPMPVVGASCQHNGDCGRGQLCMGDNTCQLPRNENETCSSTLYCRKGLNCNNGTCTARPATLGASCDATNKIFCADDQSFFCSPQNQCVAIEWATIGKSCGVTSSKAVICSGLDTCSGVTCVDGPADGGDCDPEADSCRWPAYCSAERKCMLPTASSVCGVAPAAH